MIRELKDLSPDQKVALESLLGRPVSERETIIVQAFEPPVISDQQRQEIADALRQHLAEVEAKRPSVASEEAEEAEIEAIRSTRPGYRPRP